MRRRFGRRRARRDEEGGAPIDPRVLERIAESGVLPVASLEEQFHEDISESFARIGLGQTEGGDRWLVAASAHSGGDALLAALVAASRLPEGAAPSLAAVAPAWDAASRQRLALVAGEVAARALSLPAVFDSDGRIQASSAGAAFQVPLAQVTDTVPADADRALFRRASEALIGLAAKHGGAVRGAGGSVELVILGRRVAQLLADARGIVLESLPGRESQVLRGEELAEALDRLEGLVRKRLNDRRVREGEEGLRGRLIPGVIEAAGLRTALRWPVAGADPDVIDLVGVTREGAVLVAALRERLGLGDLARVLDAAAGLEPALPAILSGAEPPVRLTLPGLVLAAGEFDPAVESVLQQLALPVTTFEVRDGTLHPKLQIESRLAPETPLPQVTSAPSAGTPAGEPPREGGEAGEAGPSRSRRGRGRGRGRGRRSEPRAEAEASGASGAAESAEPDTSEGPRFDEVSLFDLDDEAPRSESGGRQRGRRRGRGRQSGRSDEPGRQATSPEGAPGEGTDDESGEGRQGRRRGRGGRSRRRDSAGPSSETGSAAGASSLSGDEEDLDEDLLQLSPDVPDFDEPVVPGYDDDDDEGEPETELDRIRHEREKRRLARHAVSGPAVEEEIEEPVVEAAPTSLPRGRAAILTLASRDAIAAGVLLARDLRQVEGFWVYPQEELMTFFRGVAIDLRENTPIYVVGFVPKPARDAIQAASLYRGRLVWFDHHEWPPEDRDALREAIGEDVLYVEPGLDSVLPVVLGACSRRSRFSDKLVDLATGRFSHHDFGRWGRLWWSRFDQMAGNPGDRRADLESLLAGRPSDLAREASRLDVPPPPPELEYVSSRDFRLVHFGGLALVVATVPSELDLHMTMRIARERYAAALSLAHHEGSENLVLGADDVSGRRAIDVTGMVEHLAQKYTWVEALSDADHVARVRVRDLGEHSERLDELVAEIGMGRSILEG